MGNKRNRAQRSLGSVQGDEYSDLASLKGMSGLFSPGEVNG